MRSTLGSYEWRDDVPRTFSRAELPPHLPTVTPPRRRFTAALLIPRLVALSVRR